MTIQVLLGGSKAPKSVEDSCHKAMVCVWGEASKVAAVLCKAFLKFRARPDAIEKASGKASEGRRGF